MNWQTKIITIMKRFYLILPLVAMLFSSCELLSVSGKGDNGDDNGNGGGGIVSDADRVEVVYLYGLNTESSNDDMQITKVAMCLGYDDEGRVESLSHIAFVEKGAISAIRQKIDYETSPATITTSVERLVRCSDDDPNLMILERSAGDSGVAYFNSLGYLSALAYGDYFSCYIGYSTENNRVNTYTGGSGSTVRFVWEDGNLVGLSESKLKYSDDPATWYGLDWLWLLANGHNESNALLSVLNTNRGLHSKNLPIEVSAGSNKIGFDYTFDSKGRLSTVKMGGKTAIEIFLYESDGEDFGYKWAGKIVEEVDK